MRGGLQVYILRRGHKPEPVPGAVVTGQMPATFDHEGVTYYFCGADLSRKTISFSETKGVLK